MIKDIYKSLQLTENIEKFVDDIYEENKTNIEDLTDEGLKKFVEKQKSIYQKATSTIQKEDNENIPTGDDQKDDKNPFLKEPYNPEDYI